MLERLVFIDETSLGAKLVKTIGRAPGGRRLIGHAAFGHVPSATGTPRTLVADLAKDGPIAPSVLDGAMDRDRFGACVTDQRTPALRPDQIVVADQPSSHRLTRAPGLLRA